MRIRLGRFNIYLALALALVCAGCKTRALRPDKKELSTIRLFLGSKSASGGTGEILVTRQKIPLNLEPEPFLTEEDLVKAAVVDYPDGTFAIQLQFNQHGALVLDMTTVENKGKLIAVFSQFPALAKQKKQSASAPASTASEEGKPRTSAWLGAVLIRSRTESGSFRFTPDASHVEAERIVRGLNNLVAEVNKKNKNSSLF